MKLSGRAVAKGRVEGLARIINSYEDLENVEKGDVLITAQTDMNYVPYLQQCVGLVTEHGGRYSHAAIYARENELPCITGVRDARTSFRDGSPIVLDATRNEVYQHDHEA